MIKHPINQPIADQPDDRLTISKAAKLFAIVYEDFQRELAAMAHDDSAAPTIAKVVRIVEEMVTRSCELTAEHPLTAADVIATVDMLAGAGRLCIEWTSRMRDARMAALKGQN